jgi:hypothetical protein
VAGTRAHRQRCVHQRRQALDDGQAQAQPLALVRLQRAVGVHLVELVEDARQRWLGDADAAVPHLHQQPALAQLRQLTSTPPSSV